MPPSYKSRRPNKARGHKSARKDQVVRQVADFSASRVGDIGDDEGQALDPFDDAAIEEEQQFDETEEVTSEEEEVAASRSYATLLKTLKSAKTADERASKRRKLDNASGVDINHDTEYGNGQNGGAAKEEISQATDSASDADEQIEEFIDSDDEAETAQDPFERRFTSMEETELARIIESQSQKAPAQKGIIGKDIRKVNTSGGLPIQDAPRTRGLSNHVLKHKLRHTGEDTLKDLTSEELDVASETFAYRDILCGNRTPRNSKRLRDSASLHILNHMLKTRDRVLKNNSKLAQDSMSEGEYRDQGFTRPKILIILPTKQSCASWVESLIKIIEPDQQENRSRFLEQYSAPDDDTFNDRPEDFQELFNGNREEDFRVGLKLTRKTIKFFSGFYNSDIILTSPLGLMRTIKSGSSNSEDESKKGLDADFLSSIEICVIDQATALEQQNWSHVDYIFSHLNQIPRESHGCDFARVRHFYLNDQSKYLRQVLVFAAYITPSIQSLATTHMHNISGRVRYTPTYTGAMLDLSPTMPMTITQTFLRFESNSPHDDNDKRFNYFTTTILSHLLRNTSKASNRGTLIFVPTYLDFVRLRNHFATATETTALSFGTISEYSSRGEVARTRAHFRAGKHSILLYTERSHHYFRYKLKGVRRLIFYGLPENPLFWTELIAMLGANATTDLEWAQSLRGKQGKGLVRALFSKWDYMKLERVVGTERVARLVSDTQGDVFEFV